MVYNSRGANLLDGVISAFIQAAGKSGRLQIAERYMRPSVWRIDFITAVRLIAFWQLPFFGFYVILGLDLPGGQYSRRMCGWRHSDSRQGIPTGGRQWYFQIRRFTECWRREL